GLAFAAFVRFQSGSSALRSFFWSLTFFVPLAAFFADFLLSFVNVVPPGVDDRENAAVRSQDASEASGAPSIMASTVSPALHGISRGGMTRNAFAPRNDASRDERCIPVLRPTRRPSSS